MTFPPGVSHQTVSFTGIISNDVEIRIGAINRQPRGFGFGQPIGGTQSVNRPGQIPSLFRIDNIITADSFYADAKQPVHAGVDA
jgi:hypothetical protein